MRARVGVGFVHNVVHNLVVEIVFAFLLFSTDVQQ
jgi:hypothetical protein